MRAKLLLAAVVGAFVVWACSSNSNTPAPITYTIPCPAGTCAAGFPAIWDAGMVLSYVDSYRLGICAWQGQTLSGAGTMQDTWGNSQALLPFRNADLDKTVPAAANGIQCLSWADYLVPEVSPEPDYVYFGASGVTVSGVDGGPLTVYLYPHRVR